MKDEDKKALTDYLAACKVTKKAIPADAVYEMLDQAATTAGKILFVAFHAAGLNGAITSTLDFEGEEFELVFKKVKK